MQDGEEHPPPYEGPSSPQPAAPVASGSSLQPVTNPIFQPAGTQRINGYWLSSVHNTISGNYIIDTSHAKSFLGDCPPEALMPLDERNKMYFKEEKTTSNVSFHTTHGSIKVNLSIEGGPEKRCYISSWSVHGMIFIEMAPLQPSKHFLIEAKTTHGKIIILLPPTFDGLVQIRKVYSPITFLPEFAKYAQLLRGSDEDSLVRFTRADSTPITEAALLSETLDHCLVGSVHGSITLGISGYDHWEPPSVRGLLEKIKGIWS